MKRFIISVLFCCAAFPAFAGMKEGDAAMEKEDYKTALKEYSALAKKGNAEAQANMGDLYRQGSGVQKDDAQAFAWYLKAANQNDARAQFIVGILYQQGRGVEANVPEGLKWLRKSADQGYAKAQFQLGSQYNNGQGFEKNPTEGMAWLNKAAAQGFVMAQAQLGTLYMQQGQFADGVKWLTLAAEAGDTDSIVDLGMAYGRGDGVEQNVLTAYQFMVVAANIGHDERAIKIRDALEPKLSAHDKKEATARALQWGMQHKYMLQ